MLQEEQPFLPSEQNENIFSDLLPMNFSEPSNLKEVFKFHRRLISKVRKRRQLYDPKHRLFSDIKSKQKIWKKIADNINEDVDKCKNTWADLRCEYQRYARRLRKYLLYGNTQRKRRPVMALETDLLFLWRFIPQQSRAPHPFFKPQPIQNIVISDDEDDIVIIDQEPVVIILDDEEKTESTAQAPAFKLSAEMHKLIDLVKNYPELYDSEHQYFKDFRRKGIIWNAIANESNDKATKLMKLWIQLQTRFEWEMENNKTSIINSEIDIRFVMSFLASYIQKNQNTVYKQSVFLKNIWFEPIDHFKNIYNLISILKRCPRVVCKTEEHISKPTTNSAYISFWNEVSKMKDDATAGQCETTWLILRFFYWELMKMRNHCYQLQDKWYFESIITDLYASLSIKTITTTTAPSSTAKTTTTYLTSGKSNTNNFAASVPSVPATVATATTTPIYSPNNVSISNSPALLTFSTPVQQMVLPKIVSAKSLAPAATTTQANKANPATKAVQILPVIPPNAMSIIPANGTHFLNQNAIYPKTLQQLPQQPQQTPQLSGPYTLPTLPKIASVKTMARPQNIGETTIQPISMNNLNNSNSHNVISNTPNLLTMTTTETTRPMLTITPTSLLSTTAQQLQLHQMPQLSQPSPQIVPITSLQTTPFNVFNEANMLSQNNNLPTTLTELPIGTRIFPNLIIGQTPTPPTNNSPTPMNATQTSIQGFQSLNYNEIMIELISSSSGNQLLVHGPPLEMSFTLSMEQTTAFIREVMGIPLLHNKSYAQGSRVQAFWVYIASKFNMPAHVCRAVWNFLSENFNHFSQIAPMEVLMAPFETEAKAWQDGTVLFKKFYEDCNKKGWLLYEHKLPLVMEKIGKHRILYQDLLRSWKGTELKSIRNQKVSEIWKKLRAEFNIDDIEEIFIVFKTAFWQYMLELEIGFVNHWPLRLWRAISKLDFLIRQRYNVMEPFFYIVRNKFNEEIQRCTEREQKSISPIPTFSASDTDSRKAYDIDPYQLLTVVKRYSDIYLFSSTSQKEKAWYNVAKELNVRVSACRVAFQRALKNYRSYMVRDPANRCRLNHRYYKNMHAIYRAVKSAQKICVKTPTELNQSVSDAPDPNDIIFPERMIFDITMDNCSPSLVLKNWAYGISNCTPNVQIGLPDKFHALFAKYKNRVETKIS